MSDLMTLLKILKVLQTINQFQSAPHGPPPELRGGLAEVSESILKCYHPTAQFRAVDIIEYPWSRGAQYNADKSVLLRIRWDGTINPNYVTIVAIVQRGTALRAPVLNDTALFRPSRNCAFNDWVQVRTQ
jgi:hypothetical protein